MTTDTSERGPEGKKIIISTVQKFPFILDEIGSDHRGRKFAIIIDEAHSSQGGRTSAALSMALGAAGVEEDDEFAQIARVFRMSHRRPHLGELFNSVPNLLVEKYAGR